MSSKPPPPPQLIEDMLAIRQWSAQRGTPPGAEVDTVNLLVGSGLTSIAAGFAGVVRVDFLSNITGAFVQEFDGTPGTASIEVWGFFGGNDPAPWSITNGAPIQVSGRYVEWDTSAWQQRIDRGTYLLFEVQAVTGFLRFVVNLRIRRLEP